MSPNERTQLLLALGGASLAGVLLYAMIRGRKRSNKGGNGKGRGIKNNFRVEQDQGANKGVLESSVHSDSSVHGGTLTTLGLEQPLVIAMVGLPARGKSYIVKMIIRYFSWIGLKPKVFNVGSFRRDVGLQSADADFFSASNADGKKIREDLAMRVQEVMYKWLHSGKGKDEQRIAIFDATNTTIERREALAQRARSENVFLLFVESICNDDEVLKRNYELKLQNEDYKDQDPAIARIDFAERVRAYERQYETIVDWEDNNRISYIKLINVGQKVISKNCFGYLPSQVAFYLQNVHINKRKIYLSLSSETMDSEEDAYKNNLVNNYDKLTESGRDYSLHLAKFIEMEMHANTGQIGQIDNNFLVLAGTAGVHAETILHLRMMCPCFTTPLLNELRAGDFHGLIREEIKRDFPDEYAKRQADKLHYRYPGVGGESYLDVIERIRPAIIELERQRRSVLVVCHLAVLRCIYAYFTGTEAKKIPFVPIKMHEVIELSPGPFGCEVRTIKPSSEVSFS
jgi:broad specificity phosphatase PhoE/predicted kinase